MEIVATLFSGPLLPATLLLVAMLFWSFLGMLGSIDLDMPGAELDLDVDLDATGGNPIGDGMSTLAIKWVNLKSVPLIVWLGVFSVIWWFISACLWTIMDQHFFSPPGWIWSALLAVKNAAIGVLLTKFATAPMARWFVTEKLSANSIVGQECEISSLTANEEFGQVKYKTEGSPLLLNVRTDGSELVRGTRVWITHYDAKNRLYIVSPTTTGAADVLSSEE